MGFKSDIRIVTSKEGFKLFCEFMKARLNENDKNYSLINQLEIKAESKEQCYFGWNNRKGLSVYSDVNAIRATLHYLLENEYSYRYIRIGEDYDDTQAYEFDGKNDIDKKIYLEYPFVVKKFDDKSMQNLINKSNRETIYEYEELDDGTISITGVLDIKSGEIVIPSEINGKRVTVIDHYAFESCFLLKSIIIPESVEEIRYRGFSDCNSLKSITISSGVKEIGECAFENCISLKSIIIPESVEEINYGAFEGCKSLKEIVLPEGVTKIGNYVFFYCTSLEKIIIPNSVTTIGKGAFLDCYSLTEIIIPESVKYIEKGAFKNCKKLKSVIINNKDVVIDKSAFINCHPNLRIEIQDSEGRTKHKRNENFER